MLGDREMVEKKRKKLVNIYANSHIKIKKEYS